VGRIARELGYRMSNVYVYTLHEATKDRVIRGLEQAWFAELAVHGRFDLESPGTSYILLSGGEATPQAAQKITLDECLSHAIKLDQVRLLVLSACETSLHDVFVANELLGRATGFLRAGVAGVIAALWTVDDRATYILMSRFARLYLDPSLNLSPAQALAQAQYWLQHEATNHVLAEYYPTAAMSGVSLLRSLRYSYNTALAILYEHSLNDDSDALPFENPYYWAGFTVLGC
jgi:CHAT domain-containing protein